MSVKANDRARTPAVANVGAGDEGSGAARCAAGVVEELVGHGVVDAQLAVRNAAARHEAVRRRRRVAVAFTKFSIHQAASGIPFQRDLWNRR